ncbi:DUF1289 domain-containing protein [Chachezhania sediminis]|uniref:DUF1289 domain-containing protein n=1 Tax=Chachezhania sediminis TaxID=2599291 RepID=UPI00131ED028|nr:DUF1289 domain-containing protein [Chachezhania sediminis]
MTRRGRSAKEEVWSRKEIASPCVRVCVLHPEEKICIGCYRTGEEIGRWSLLTDEERAGLMKELPTRAASLTRRRGGRARRSAERRQAREGFE